MQDSKHKRNQLYAGLQDALPVMGMHVYIVCMHIACFHLFTRQAALIWMCVHD